MNVLIVIKAIGDVAGAINNIYLFAKNVQEFFAEPTDVNRERYSLTYLELMRARSDLLLACGQILTAIVALEERIFREVLSDKLGDIDQALQDLENWQRNESEVLKSLALDRSAGAVADMLQYAVNGVYPRPAMVFAFAEILTGRLAILKEADPEFCKSPRARQPLEDGVAVIRAAANEIEAAVRRENVINESRSESKKLNEEGIWDYYVTAVISYSNLSRTVSYSETVGPFERGDEGFREGVLRARAAAQAAENRGLLDDWERARIPTLRSFAVTLDESIRLCELEMLSQALPYPIGRVARARFILARREMTLSQSAQVVFAGVGFPSAEESRSLDISKLGEHLLQRRPTDDEARVLADVANVFGHGSLMQLLINHADSTIK